MSRWKQRFRLVGLLLSVTATGLGLFATWGKVRGVDMVALFAGGFLSATTIKSYLRARPSPPPMDAPERGKNQKSGA